MLYVRYANRQARYTLENKPKAFADILKLGLAEFDVYNSDSRSVVFGAYRTNALIRIDEDTTEQVTAYHKTINQARATYAALKKSGVTFTFSVDHYRTDSRSWDVVYPVAAKAATC